MRKELATLDLGTALCVGSIGGLGGVRLYEKIVYPNSRFEERTDFVTGDRIRGLTTDTR